MHITCEGQKTSEADRRQLDSIRLLEIILNPLSREMERELVMTQEDKSKDWDVIARDLPEVRRCKLEIVVDKRRFFESTKKASGAREVEDYIQIRYKVGCSFLCTARKEGAGGIY